MMANHMREVGVQHRLITVPEGAHGIGNIAPEEQERIYREAAVFLMKRV